MATKNNETKTSAAKTAGTKKRMTKKERKARQKKRMILFGVEAVLIVVLAVILFLVTKVDKMEATEIDESDITFNEGISSEGSTTGGEVPESMKGYRNIALFGVDSRTGALGKGTLSDTIIVASINEDTKEVRLVSVFRDTYLNLSNDTYNKANSAYSKGGPKQAINMLNMNLDLNITDYVTVGFQGVVDTVDALGGVEIDVDEAEINHLNNYQVGTSEAIGRKNQFTRVTSTGLQTLDGIQATSYCRIRYTAGDDFKRAERQREVIQAIAAKVKNASASQLNDIANKVFSQTATSLELSEILSLLGDVKDYTIVATDGFPFEDMRATGTVPGKGSCVMPVSLESNVVQLHKFLFNTDGYEPSANVREYSAKIHQDTGK
ncbi:MAG: LCP family protein [Lachnospiraceae bacterium]|nr:LCP family protein [Lachnospiraceae bacterium]